MTSSIVSGYQLSPAQQGILVDSLGTDTPGLYVEQLVSVLTGAVDTARAEAAWRRVTERHEALRTCIRWQLLDRPLQIVLSGIEPTFELHEPSPATALEEFAAAERARGFDLTEAPLARLALLPLAPARCLLVLTYHHVILDGGSRDQVLRDFVAAYNRPEDNEPPGEAAGRYRDFIAWQLRQPGLEAAERWRTELSGIDLPTPVPVVGTRGDRPPGGFFVLEGRLDEDSWAVVRRRAAEAATTPNTLFEAAWAVILSRLGGQQDVVFGRVGSIRPPFLDGDGRPVGLFVNPVPIRARIHPDLRCAGLVRQLHDSSTELRTASTLPLAALMAGLPNLQRGRRVFDSILAWEASTAEGTLAAMAGVVSAEVAPSISVTPYPVMVMGRAQQYLEVRLIGDRAALRQEDAEELLSAFLGVLDQLGKRPWDRLGDLAVLGLGVRVLLGAVRRGRQRRTGTGDDADSAV
jgi:hypothetical protein